MKLFGRRPVAEPDKPVPVQRATILLFLMERVRLHGFAEDVMRFAVLAVDSEKRGGEGFHQSVGILHDSHRMADCCQSPRHAARKVLPESRPAVQLQLNTSQS